MNPTIGAIVWYRMGGAEGSYTAPAMIVATQDTLAAHLKPLLGDTNVHLVVFTAESGAHKPIRGGTMQAFDVPYDEDAPPGTWKWPVR